ncbi:MAG: DUF1343 domain-containing protein, partial [Ginsengibacter sp.]
YQSNIQSQSGIIPGAERMDVYVPLLKGKKVALLANQTSLVGNTHLLDTLLKRGVNVMKVFGPEHGFRGSADAGEKINSSIDKATGVKVISLYGDYKQPTTEDLQDVDILIFDIQDVGVRFYTYISTLEYFMEAALQNAKPLVILDRPNPLGYYVDGPVLDKKFKSFVGMQSIPIVYGLTIGEYAMMIAGERWLSEKANEKFDYYRHAKNSADTPFHLLVIRCTNYDHTSKYVLPVKPSPNLPEIQSIYWYPSTCLFEGTVLSEGRGTEKPFQIFGHPSLPKTLYSFTPVSREGATAPKLKDATCYGWNVSGTPEDVLKKTDHKLQLQYLLDAYKQFPDKDKFFLPNNTFNRLAGNDVLQQQIIADKNQNEVRQSWEPALSNYKSIRKKYLLYKDFEQLSP